MNKNKKKGARGSGNMPTNGGGGGGDRNWLKTGESTQLHVHEEAGANGESRPVMTKYTGTSGDDLTEGKQVNSSCEAHEQRGSGRVGFRTSTATSGNAWNVTTRVGGGCQNCGDSLVSPPEKDKGPSSVEAALGVGANVDTCAAGPCNAGVDTYKDGSIKSTSTSSNASSSTSGSDSKGKRNGGRNANSEAGQSNNTANGAKGLTSCWKRADGRKNSRAYAVAAGRALGIIDEKAAAAGTEVTAAVPKREVDSCSGALTKQAAGVAVSSKKEEKREQQGKPSSIDRRRQTGVQQRVQSVLQEEELTKKKEGPDAADGNGDRKSVLSNFLQWQQHSPAFDSVGDALLSGNASSHSCYSKQLQTQKPCQLLRSQTATEGAGGGHATAGRQRQLVHSKSLGCAPTQLAGGGIRASEEGRAARHLTRTAASEGADETQPMRSSALALQSALVSLLQVQEKQNGGNGRTSKPVMPRRNLMCTSLLRTGVCANPERCNYAHNLLELQKKLELRKTSLCKYWLRGKCENDDCNFAHGEHELQSTDGVYKTTICKYWKQGACYSGSSCRHAHGEDDLRPERLPPHLERKRLQQLQKVPWRSSSFSPTTTSSTSATTAIFDRTQSAIDVNRATGRSEVEASAAARCLLTKSLTSGDVSHLFSPLHGQDREEPPRDLAAIAAQVLAIVAAGTRSTENVLLEALKSPLRPAEKKSKPYDTVVEDTAAILSSAASVLSRVRMLHREDTNNDTALRDSTKQLPTMKSDRHRENAKLLQSAALPETATSESELQADQLLQLWDNILPCGGRVRGPPPGMDGGEQGPNGREGLRGSAAAGAAAAVVGAAGGQIQTSLPSPETSVAAKQVAIQPKLNALMSTICYSLLERQLASNERVPPDDGTGVSGTSPTNSEEHDFLPALLSGVNTGTRQQWLAGDIGEVSQFQLNRRTSSLSKSTTRSPCAAVDIPGLVCEKPHAAAALPSEIERFSAEDASGVAATNSTRSSCLQDTLGCCDLPGRAGVIAGSGERHSLRLQELLAEQMTPTTGTQAESDKASTFHALPASRLGSDRHAAYSAGISPASGECGGLGKESLAASPPVGLDSYRCAALVNNNIYAGARSTPLDVASPTVIPGDGDSLQRTGGGRGSGDCTGTPASAFPRDRPGDPPEVVNDSLGESLVHGTGSAFGLAGTGVEGGNCMLSGNDNRFSSACWRATDAEATLLNQRSSSTVQLEAPLNRSATLPSMSDYMVEGTGDGRCRTGLKENTASTQGSYPYPQLQQRSLTGYHLTGAGEKEEAKESGHSLWPSTPGFTFTELFERGAQECVALDEDAFGAVGAAGVSDSAAALHSGITGLKKRKEEQHELVARAVWGQTTFFEQNNPANTNLEPVSESARAVNTVFDNDVLAELSESVAALRIMAAENDLRLAGKGKMVMQPLKENVDESEEDAVQYASLSKNDSFNCRGRCNCSSDNGRTCRISEQTFCSVSDGAHGSCCNISSCGVTPQHDDASVSGSSWCLSTVGGVRTPSGGAPTSSVDCASPSALSDSGGSGKIGRKLLDLSSSSSTIFPP